MHGRATIIAMRSTRVTWVSGSVANSAIGWVRPRTRNAWSIAPLFFSGCATAGNWQAVAIDPPGAAFPIQQMTLDPKGNFTTTGLLNAAGAYDGKIHTSTGGYREQWCTLYMDAQSGPENQYAVTRRLDGKLVLTYRSPSSAKKVSATFSRAAN